MTERKSAKRTRTVIVRPARDLARSLGADAVGEMMERRFEDALDRRPSSERRLCAGGARAPARLDVPRIAVPGECRQLSSRRVPKQSLHGTRRALSELTDGGDADRGEPRLGRRATPHMSATGSL